MNGGALEQFREVVVHAPDAKIGFAVKRLAEVVNAVRVAIEKFDDGEDEVVRFVERIKNFVPGNGDRGSIDIVMGEVDR